MSIEALDNPEEIKRRIAEIEQQISTQSLPDDEMLRLAEERDALWQKLQSFDESVIVEIPEPRVNVRIDSSSRRILVYVNNALVAEAETLSGQAGGLGVNSYWESSTKRLKMVMSTTPGVNVEFLHEKIEQLSPLLIEFGIDVANYSQPVWLETETVPEEFPVEADQSSQAALTNEPPEIVWSDVSEWVHGALDITGLVPGVGEIADGINAGIYLAEGRYAEAAISAAAMIPVVGDAGKAGKWAVKGGKEVVEATARGGKELAGVTAEQTARRGAVDNIGEQGARLSNESSLVTSGKSSKRPPLRRGNAPSFPGLKRFPEKFNDPKLVEEQQRILELAKTDHLKAGNQYQELVAADLRGTDVQEMFSRPGRRLDIGTHHEVTIEGMRRSFGSHKLNQLWNDLEHEGLVLLTVPKLSEKAANQLKKLGAQAEEVFGKSVLIIVRETL